MNGKRRDEISPTEVASPRDIERRTLEGLLQRSGRFQRCLLLRSVRATRSKVVLDKVIAAGARRSDCPGGSRSRAPSSASRQVLDCRKDGHLSAGSSLLSFHPSKRGVWLGWMCGLDWISSGLIDGSNSSSSISQRVRRSGSTSEVINNTLQSAGLRAKIAAHPGMTMVARVAVSIRFFLTS